MTKVQDSASDVRADFNTSLAGQIADQLRRLASLVETNPELAASLMYAFRGINIPIIAGDGNRRRDTLAAFARAGLAANATVGKDFSDKWAGVQIGFGKYVGIYVYADRDEVCEKVVTGTREVTKEIPDPDALAAVPTVTVTETVEDVEWVCRPLLDSERLVAQGSGEES